MDTGLVCLLMIAGYHGIASDEAQLRHEFGQADFSTDTIRLAAKNIGMLAKLVNQDPGRLDRAPLPAIAIDRSGLYFIAGKYDAGGNTGPRMLIQHPGEPLKL